MTKKKKQWKPKPFAKLANRNYPIGHATGLSDKEWRQFANTYDGEKHKDKGVFQ